MTVQTDLRAGGGYRCGGRKGCGYFSNNRVNILSHWKISHSDVDVRTGDVEVEIG